MSKRKKENQLSKRELNYLKRCANENLPIHEHLKVRLLKFGIDATELHINEILLRLIKHDTK